METPTEHEIASQAHSSCCGGPVSTTATVNSEDANKTTKEIKSFVREKYGTVATQKTEGESANCGCDCSDDVDMIGNAYADLEGHVTDADMGLGCGVPTEIANLKEGEAVLDLGSGGGIDAFVARRHVGDQGRVVGVDFTPEMVDLANRNTQKLGYDNVSFLLGDIEELPLPDSSFDIILSNCVLNLVPNKEKAFAEMYRVLKPGGRFSVSDIVTRGELPASLQRSLELYAGCVAGALDRNVYRDLLRAAGFEGITVERSREIDVPAHLLGTEAKQYVADGGAILSITVTGKRPGQA